MTNTLHDVLTFCIAEATNELGPKLLNPSEIYADMARRLLGVSLEQDAGHFAPTDQIITVRVADLEAWLLEAYDQANEDNVRTSVSWRMTPVGWKPSIEERRPTSFAPMCTDPMCHLSASPHPLSSSCPPVRS